ncbi:TPA: hypothetical protein ACG6V8_000870 [Streptococcus agalactiae]
MNKYERYRDTGLIWINKVPKKWNLQKINAVFDERREKVSDKDYVHFLLQKMEYLSN